MNSTYKLSQNRNKSVTALQILSSYYSSKNFGKASYNIKNSFSKDKNKYNFDINNIINSKKSKIQIKNIILNQKILARKVYQENTIGEKYNKNDNEKNHQDKKNITSDNDIKSASTKDSSFTSDFKSIVIRRKANEIDFSFAKKNYCNYLPKKGEMMIEAPKKPSNLPIEIFLGLDKNHNEIGNNLYLNLNSYFINRNNDSYKIIDKKDHILLNHLCLKSINKKIINSFIVKYRHKNATFLYYN